MHYQEQEDSQGPLPKAVHGPDSKVTAVTRGKLISLCHKNRITSRSCCGDHLWLEEQGWFIPRRNAGPDERHRPVLLGQGGLSSYGLLLSGCMWHHGHGEATGTKESVTQSTFAFQIGRPDSTEHSPNTARTKNNSVISCLLYHNWPIFYLFPLGCAFGLRKRVNENPRDFLLGSAFRSPGGGEMGILSSLSL